ncbi:MAG: flagellar biosynthetic protein FliR [Deltaproteobacteria bacterium]|nr:flagellar biosynthetic protein FliR [Deltaproteobacteria bacterium]
MGVVGDLLALGQDRVAVLVLALARVAGLFLMAPIFASRTAPVRVRAALVFFVTLAMLPLLGRTPPALAADAGAVVVLGMLAFETMIGFVLGLVAQLTFGAVQMAGQLAGIQMGIGLANLIDPQTQEHVTSLAQWQNLVALLIFLSIDGHHVLIRAVADSFAVLPLGGGLPAAAGFGVAMELAGGLFVIALKIAAPVLVLLLLVNAAMGVLAKLIPQLNVFIVGFPLNVAAGLFVLAASQPFTVRLLETSFGELQGSLAHLVRALG